MTRAEKISFKHALKQVGLTLIEQRIAAARSLMDDAQQAANGEEKSSAGDKYETSRAMGHLQKDMHARQLAEQAKELAALHAVNVDLLYDTVATGALIECEKATFFVAAGLGKQTIGDKTVFFLSPQAPLAQQLQHKKAGDHFVFNTLRTIIVDLY
jgi:transcription elongation GreA/GreB family factor